MRTRTQPHQQARAQAFMNLVLQNDQLRNRNPLHASVVDASVISNLMNFPKHIFGFPFASYGTNGTPSICQHAVLRLFQLHFLLMR